METISQVIKDLRALNMTQAEIAEKTGLRQAYISQIESGKRGSRTPAETLERAIAVRDRLLADNNRRITDKKSP